jgi:YVTN family beta-propeller protein
VRATATGRLFVRVEVQRGPKAYAATRRLRIGIDRLAAGGAIAADGSRNPDPAVAGSPGDGFFDPAYLVTFDDPGGAIEADRVNDRRMQPAVADRLRALMQRISDGGGSGTLRLASGWVPGDPGLAGVGRAVTLDPAGLSLDAQRLAGLAHAVGFSYVQNDAGLVRLLHEAGDMIEITGPDEIKEDEPAPYSVTPRAHASAAAAADGTGPPARGNLYVTNAGTDTVSEIDSAAGTVRRVFKVGAAPTAVAVAPDGARVYTADSASASISTVDIATGQLGATLQLGGSPQALRHHPTRRRLYVAVPQLGQLIELDTSAAPAIARALTLGPLPVDVALTRDGSQAWVVLSQSRRIAVVDTTTMSTVGTINLSDTPTRVAVGPTRAYVTMAVARKLAVINVATRTVVTVIPNLGTSPGAAAVSDDGQTVYVADVAGGGLFLRNLDGSAMTGAGAGGFVPLSGAPVHLELSPTRAYIVRQDIGDGRSTDDVTTLSVDPPGRVLAAWPLGTGHGERLSWSLQAGTPARASLSGTTKPEIDLRPASAGAVLLRASYLWPDHSPPRTFQVRFSEAVRAKEASGTVVRLRKDDYDLVMNVLNALHPVGVEVGTAELRNHVAELADNLDLFPGYTYPDFRSRRPPPVRQRGPQPGTPTTSGTSER